MIKYTVECDDLFTGEKRKSDLYFHLTEAELTMLNLSANNKYSTFNENTNMTNEEQIKLFEKLISKAYGEKDEKGRFIKNDNIRDAFLCSPEYSEFLSQLISDEVKIGEFIIGCLPKEISSKLSIDKDGKPVINQ